MLVILPTLRVSAASRGNSELEENRTENIGGENEQQTHLTERGSASPHTRSRFWSVVRVGGSGRGWADTAHATELQPVFCSVVRIGRFGREWADTAHTTDDACRPDRTFRPLPDLASRAARAD